MPSARRVMPIGGVPWASAPWHVLLPVVVYVFICLAGVSQSSIGTPELREDPSDPAGLMLGEARPIRSDEFLTATPLGLGVTATGQAEDVNPLTAPQAMLSVLPAGPVTTVLFLDGAALELGPVLPDQVLMSARTWLGTLLLLLAAPAWFRTITGSRWVGYFAVALVFFSPHNAWWSNTPATILGFAFGGAVALQRAALAVSERRFVHAVAWVVGGAVLLVRTPLLYPPWALVLVSAVLLPTVASILGRPGSRRSSLVATGAVGGLSLIFLAAMLWENRAAVEAASNTIYPGSRVETGGPNSFQSFFAATNLDVLADVDVIVAGNQSEISSGFTVALVVAVLVLARGFRARSAEHRWAVSTLLVVTAFWTMWATIDFGSVGLRLPLVNMVPAGRSAQIIGHVAVIALCLLLPSLERRGSRAFSALAAGAAALVAAYAGSLVRVAHVPELSVRAIWLSAGALAVVVFLITFRPRSAAGYVLGGALAFSLVWNVNPLLFGLADLRGSEVAKDMLRAGDAARAEGDVWVADAYAVDSLMMATGVPAISGRQMTGPDIAEWTKLDPGRTHDEVWNRGGSYIWFSWTQEDELTFANPSPDVIAISGSPCVVADRLPELTTVVSVRELDMDCLRPVRSFEWGGLTRWVYAVSS